MPDFVPAPPADARPWWCWINRLALDAVAVALAWLYVFARMTGARLMPVEVFSLGITVWLIYLSDRMLDAGTGLGTAERHRWAGKHARWLLPWMAAAVTGTLWWALHAMRWMTLQAALWLGVGVVLYFGMLLVSRRKALSQMVLVAVNGLLVMGLVQGEELAPGGVQLWRAVVIGALATVLYVGLRYQYHPPPWILTKKALGGYLFALGVAVVPYSHVGDWPGLLHGTPVVLFASACTLNSLGIRLWENEASGLPEMQMLRRLFPWLLAAVGAGALAQAWVADQWTRPVLCGVAGCVAGFGVLHAAKHRWPVGARSLAADVWMVATAFLVQWAGRHGLP